MKQKVLGLSLLVGLMLTGCKGNVSSTESPAPSVSASETPATSSSSTPTTPEVTHTEIKAVTTFQAGDNNVLVCYPENNFSDSSPLITSCTAPVFLLYGDSAYTEETAKAFLKNSGLAEVAAKEGSSIVIVNPVGETWSDADKSAYDNVVNLISDSSTATIKDGISTSVNMMTKAEQKNIVGTTERIYVYGIGKGADFAAENLVKPLKGSVTYPDGYTRTFDNTIAGASLEHMTKAVTVPKSDIPVMSIGNSDEINQGLSLAGSLTKADSVDYAEQYQAVVGRKRRQAGVLISVHDWAEEGIVEKVETKTLKTSSDNVTFQGKETHDVSYATYYASDLNVHDADAPVPLVFCFHGGGNTALFEAQATEWPLIGKANGFITVAVDLHFPNVSAKETIDLLGEIEKEYSIDTTRIYASGFSMGGCKSWDLYEQYPTAFAGLAPMDAVTAPGNDSFGNTVTSPNADTIVPVFYVGGEASPLPELPCQSDRAVARIKNLLTVNQVGRASEYDSINYDERTDSTKWVNSIWGINGDYTYVDPDTKYFKDSVLTVQTFKSTDGNTYTALASSSNQSHEVYARNSYAAWNFLKQFSRASDGTIKIAK